MLNAFYLDDVPHLPLSAFGHPIDGILPFLRTQLRVYSIIHLTTCFTHRPLYGLLCHFILFYVIHTPIQVYTPKPLFLLLNSILHLLIPPTCLFSFTFAFFGHSEFFLSHFSNVSKHLHPNAICIPSFMLRVFFKGSLLE
jgi:hypothetical protein